ncbi:hypothetical protein [Clostridium tetani]|uniref:IDEAL domain-containing protein n=1 Tax=Clostridium tetani TaxID=1513 RepID=A0ABY0EQY3_CLOTA|nr:hypothetical protein [Clostridium tetani]KHO39789.1 hypothetical protein OR62_04160 [Clostridium tetani]RXI38452.1 hypothetical protein DP129_09435 [Clostridium tetani]RXI54210.1 hypothetical protein DP131_10275 [Clostridium tetani]RXI68872.1 hypothetical protein DQN76_08635 [Clostridium tetani]
MKINNFVVSKKNLNSKFKYGLKFIPERVLNKYSDYMLVVLRKNFKNKEFYNICFKKTTGFNNFTFDEEKFKEFIDFLNNFYKSLWKGKREDEFTIDDENKKIVLTLLDEKHMKISSVKGENRVFFLLNKEEFKEYILSLDAIYRERKILNSLESTDIDFIKKEEKKELYLETLYILLNSSIDNRDEDRFNTISKEINRIKRWL